MIDYPLERQLGDDHDDDTSPFAALVSLLEVGLGSYAVTLRAYFDPITGTLADILIEYYLLPLYWIVTGTPGA